MSIEKTVSMTRQNAVKARRAKGKMTALDGRRQDSAEPPGNRISVWKEIFS